MSKFRKKLKTSGFLTFSAKLRKNKNTNRGDVKIPASQNSGHNPIPGCVFWVLDLKYSFRDIIQNPW
jgi:hypothetical protein